jgi:hypothetical protein
MFRRVNDDVQFCPMILSRWSGFVMVLRLQMTPTRISFKLPVPLLKFKLVTPSQAEHHDTSHGTSANLKWGVHILHILFGLTYFAYFLHILHILVHTGLKQPMFIDLIYFAFFLHVLHIFYIFCVIFCAYCFAYLFAYST